MFKLKILYFKTLINQMLNHDGAYPFEHYLELLNICKERDIKSVLELGTALGLTAATFLQKKDLRLVTIEKHARLVDRAKRNVAYAVGREALDRVEFIEGRYFDVYEAWKSEGLSKSFDLIFMDAYVSRLNEVEKFAEMLNPKGVYVVSNIREDIEKSVAAKVYLLKGGKFEHIKTIDDTIFVIKK